MLRTYLLIALLLGAWTPDSGADDSLARKFGRNRVKVERAEPQTNVSATKLQTARARYSKRVEECRGRSDRQKQYCLLEAEQELRMTERRLRASAQDSSE